MTKASAAGEPVGTDLSTLTLSSEYAGRVLGIVKRGLYGGFDFSLTAAADLMVDPDDCLLAGAVLSTNPTELDLAVLRVELRWRQRRRRRLPPSMEETLVEPVFTGKRPKELGGGDEWWEAVVDPTVAQPLLDAIRSWKVCRVPVSYNRYLVTVPLSGGAMSILLSGTDGDRGIGWIESPAALAYTLRMLEYGAPAAREASAGNLDFPIEFEGPDTHDTGD